MHRDAGEARAGEVDVVEAGAPQRHALEAGAVPVLPVHVGHAGTVAAGPRGADRPLRRRYRYCPVLVAVSMARPDSLPLPLMSVRM